MSGKPQLEWPGVRFLPHHQFDTGRDTYVILAFPDLLTGDRNISTQRGILTVK